MQGTRHAALIRMLTCLFPLSCAVAFSRVHGVKDIKALRILHNEAFVT